MTLSWADVTVRLMKAETQRFRRSAIAALLMLAGTGAAGAADFVALRDIDPSIVQAMHYATPNNFTGKPVAGYENGECLVTRPTADALAKAQEKLSARGLTLVVFDCYRPTQGVQDFVDWAERKDLDTEPAKRFYAPDVPPNRLFQLGYIAHKSGHSRGGTVDLGLAEIGAKVAIGPVPATGDCRDTAATAGVRDMGTSFDCFDPRSWVGAKGLSKAQRANRKALTDAMVSAGFKPYSKEWWHFSLAAGDAGTAFDFPANAASLPDATGE
ncbi:M15 family metallopeptidase [Devosia sp.]|uniref:M15 family metallopeptidase n=1 Tax=Devosia sp. TaxID=1871048 RepID=UPI003A94167D